MASPRTADFQGRENRGVIIAAAGFNFACAYTIMKKSGDSGGM
jgi:hypothetical protein